MNPFHLFSLTLLMLFFSGQPLPIKKEQPVTIVADTSITLKTESDEFIPWTFTQKLTWDDFQCEPHKGTDAVASTSTSLGIAYQLVDGKLTYHITCNFSKIKSWGLMKTDYILAHEQGHFDITEIFARKLNEALQNYDFNRKNFKRDINEIYQSIVRQKEEYQKNYDAESDHSRNRKIQYEWLEKIDKLLAETDQFAAYP
jgi:predicted secreted Zn-dependent protease